MIYFIQSGEDGPIKIGYSKNDPQERKSTFDTGNPDNLRLLGVMEGELLDEQKLQDRFDYARKKGEWFWPVRELVDFIDSLSNKKKLYCKPRILSKWNKRDGDDIVYNLTRWIDDNKTEILATKTGKEIREMREAGEIDDFIRNLGIRDGGLSDFWIAKGAFDNFDIFDDEVPIFRNDQIEQPYRQLGLEL